MDILAQLNCLRPHLSKTNLRQLAIIIQAMLSMTGRVTMLGLSRWAEKGGSYRTIQRFYTSILPWAQIFQTYFREQLYRPGETYLLSGDETVVSKAGKSTYGLNWFYSSLAEQVIPGLSLFTLSLISVERRRSFPILVEQYVPEQRLAPEKKTKATGNPPGRPPGQKNKDKEAVVLTLELQHIQQMLMTLRTLLQGWLPITYLVLDGHFGNHNALQMVRNRQLQLISRLRSDMALFFPKQNGATQKRYGDQIRYQAIPARYLRDATQVGPYEHCTYQMTMLHKEFAQALNVVVLTRTHRASGAFAHVVLFSSDLELSWQSLVSYYRLRFQIEFNFRDAKQYWGLEDFMNITPITVTNAANLALFMVNVAGCLLAEFQAHDPLCSILDLKAYFRARRYVLETIKWLPKKPELVSLHTILANVSALGRIHPFFLSPPPP